MSHLICPRCKSNEHTASYGLSAPAMGLKVWCDECELLLEFKPDLEGMEDDHSYCFLVEAIRVFTILRRDAYGPLVYTGRD